MSWQEKIIWLLTIQLERFSQTEISPLVSHAPVLLTLIQRDQGLIRGIN